MRVLGIDLAADPKRTAAACLVLDADGARLEELQPSGLDNVAIARLAHDFGADVVAIDAPFGWPEAFVESIVAWNENGQWPTGWPPEEKDALALRVTELEVQRAVGGRPLSASSSMLAVTAWRCCALLEELAAGGQIDRVGRYCREVYPGAALRRTGLLPDGPSYKSTRATREEVVLRLSQFDGLDLTGHGVSLAATDHALDALVSALCGVASETEGACAAPPEDRRIAHEGWIWLPEPFAFDELFGDARHG